MKSKGWVDYQRTVGSKYYDIHLTFETLWCTSNVSYFSNTVLIFKCILFISPFLRQQWLLLLQLKFPTDICLCISFTELLGRYCAVFVVCIYRDENYINGQCTFPGGIEMRDHRIVSCASVPFARPSASVNDSNSWCQHRSAFSIATNVSLVILLSKSHALRKVYLSFLAIAFTAGLRVIYPDKLSVYSTEIFDLDRYLNFGYRRWYLCKLNFAKIYLTNNVLQPVTLLGASLFLICILS